MRAAPDVVWRYYVGRIYPIAWHPALWRKRLKYYAEQTGRDKNISNVKRSPRALLVYKKGTHYSQLLSSNTSRVQLVNETYFKPQAQGSNLAQEHF